MHEDYDLNLAARLTIDADARVRGIDHVDAYWESTQDSPRFAAVEYLNEVADVLEVGRDRLKSAHQPVSYMDPQERGTEIRLADEKQLFDATTESFYQTHLNVPVWSAGLTVTVKQNPLRVVSAVNTAIDDLDATLPPQEVIDRYREVFKTAAVRRTEAAFDGPPDGEDPTAGFVAAMLAGDLKAGKTPASSRAKGDEREGLRVRQGRFYVYRYKAADRLPHPEPTPPADEGFAGGQDTGAFQGPPALDVPPVDERIQDGGDYLVAEVVFSYPTPEFGTINWRALTELETGSILYLRPLTDSVNGLVFLRDPITESGNGATGPDQGNAVLNPFRDDVALPNLEPPANGTQRLRGPRVALTEVEAPQIAPPTHPTGTDFDFDVRTNDFAAVNAYYHTERFFSLVEDLGFPLSTYFDGTQFPVEVDHRGLGNAINAHCPGTGSGIDHCCYALAHTGDTSNPIGIAADWRVVLHELGGHGVLHDHVGGPNFGFAHSAGDSIAVIVNDPGSQAPDRFLLAPWVTAVIRRHDRAVNAGWAWGGSNDLNGYMSEQILATTMFRLYRAVGGDSTDLNRRRFASRLTVYLILRAIGTLTPATNPANARGFANALMAVDLLNWTSEGLFGGAYNKVIRWAFEKQGMYQPPGAPTPVATEGQPPPVDVYIDDGRAGEYPFQPVHWQTTTIWNRLAPDGGTSHEAPVLGQPNFVYVRVKNRGTEQAQNVVVRGFHCRPGAGLQWPTDFQAFTTPQVTVGTLGASNSEERVVGPFEWEPIINALGHDCLLMIVSATGDASNVDHLGPGEVIQEWRLVPNDNNIGQRNVQPVPGGGGLKGLLAGLSGVRFWIGNPNPRRAVITVAVQLPEFLRKRGWRLHFPETPRRFRLAPGKQREMVIELDPGEDFTPADVKRSRDRDIVVTVRADGGVIGGMTYRLDPSLEEPANDPVASPRPKRARPTPDAERLLDALDMPQRPVRDVRVRRVTLDIEMDDA